MKHAIVRLIKRGPALRSTPDSIGQTMIFGAHIPFAEHCGIEEIGVVEGKTRIRAPAAAFHSNNLGIAHGGLLCTMLDICMGTVCRVHIGAPVMTLDMQVAFIAPGRGTLLGEGRIVRAGKSILNVEAEITREQDGELVARGTGVFKRARIAEPAAQNSV